MGVMDDRAKSVEPYLVHLPTSNNRDRWVAGFLFAGMRCEHQINVSTKDDEPFEAKVASAFIKAAADMRAHYLSRQT